ncbi:MAG TPA: HAD-IB family phosphatase [Gemmatimonadaceae bacterium]|nr:HAD-IB family phosphatase [Gemmatimonadaceae bacterium]
MHPPLCPPARTVIFDCDSTLSALEGIESLAAGHREEVARLTEAAMRGDVPLEEVYGRRLALASPSRRRVEALGDEYIARLVPDARETVEALRRAGVEVRIMSGGVRQAVAALGRALGIPDHAVAAVAVRFTEDGEYAGFDEGSPLARSGGKREQLERWLPELARPIIIVGDGATDLEARPPADCFVAYTGVVERAPVVAAADLIVRSPSLAPVVALALGAPPADPVARAVYERGVALLDGEPGARSWERGESPPFPVSSSALPRTP